MYLRPPKPVLLAHPVTQHIWGEGKAYELLHDPHIQHQRQIKMPGLRQEPTQIKCSEVQHQTLEREVGSLLEEVEGSDSAQVAASGVAAHEEHRGAVVLLGVIDEVGSDVEAVFVSCWVGIFRGEAVADGYDG